MITNKVTTDAGGQTTDSYEYDGLDRLISEKSAIDNHQSEMSYSYDEVGNRTQPWSADQLNAIQ